MPLTANRQRFADEYLGDLNATQAASERMAEWKPVRS